MAFKGEPQTADVRESPGVRIAHLCVERGMSVAVHDPVVPSAVLMSLNLPTRTLDEGLAWADVVVLANNHQVYASLDTATTLRLVKPGVLWVDPWCLHRGSPLARSSKIRYRMLGTGTGTGTVADTTPAAGLGRSG